MSAACSLHRSFACRHLASIASALASAAMNLTVLPPELHFLQLPKSQLWGAMPAITNVLLEQGQHKGTFLAYVETLDDVSMLLDGRTYTSLMRLLPASLRCRVSDGVFKVISVSEGDSEDLMTSFSVTTGLVAALSEVLARSGISIFYVSTSVPPVALLLACLLACLLPVFC